MLTVPSLCLSSPFSDINQYVSDESRIPQRAAFDKNDPGTERPFYTLKSISVCPFIQVLGKTSANSTERAIKRLKLLKAQHVPLNKSRTSYDFNICGQSSLILTKWSVQLSIHFQYLTATYKHFESL
jgi:hypothetical protein